MIDLFEKWLKENLRAMGIEGTIHLIRRALGDDKYDVFLRTSMGCYHFDDIYWYGAQLNGLTAVSSAQAEYLLSDGKTTEIVDFEIIGLPHDHMLYKTEAALKAELAKGSSGVKQPRQTGKRSLFEHITANHHALIESIGWSVPPVLLELLKIGGITFPEGEVDALVQVVATIRDVVSYHPVDDGDGLIVTLGDTEIEYIANVE